MKLVFANRAATEQIGYSKETLTSGFLRALSIPMTGGWSPITA